MHVRLQCHLNFLFRIRFSFNEALNESSVISALTKTENLTLINANESLDLKMPTYTINNNYVLKSSKRVRRVLLKATKKAYTVHENPRH